MAHGLLVRDHKVRVSVVDFPLIEVIFESDQKGAKLKLPQKRHKIKMAAKYFTPQNSHAINL